MAQEGIAALFRLAVGFQTMFFLILGYPMAWMQTAAELAREGLASPTTPSWVAAVVAAVIYVGTGFLVTRMVHHMVDAIKECFMMTVQCAMQAWVYQASQAANSTTPFTSTQEGRVFDVRLHD